MKNYNIKTVPNQKVVKVEKEACGKQNLYAAINLEAMESAAIDLDAGAFKLWVYFAKNQNGYTFALSSKEVEQSFGMKKKQYDNAVKQLIEKGYLVDGGGNQFVFYEVPQSEEETENNVVSKGNNAVVPKSNNAVVSKGNNALYPKDTRNNTDNTLDNTLNTTQEGFKTSIEVLNPSSVGPREEEDSPVVKAVRGSLMLGVDRERLDAAKTKEEVMAALGF